VNATDKGDRPLVVSVCYGSELFEFLEKVLNRMPPLAHFSIDRPLFSAIGFGRDHRLDICLFQHVQNPQRCVISLVRKKSFDPAQQFGQQSIATVQIMSLTWGEMEARRIVPSASQLAWTFDPSQRL